MKIAIAFLALFVLSVVFHYIKEKQPRTDNFDLYIEGCTKEDIAYFKTTGYSTGSIRKICTRWSTSNGKRTDEGE